MAWRAREPEASGGASGFRGAGSPQPPMPIGKSGPGRRGGDAEECAGRLARVRGLMAARGLDACIVTAPENIYYLCGLDHQGYFAFQALIVGMEGEPALVTRAMERATVHDTVAGVHHLGYSDGGGPPHRPDELALGEILDPDAYGPPAPESAEPAGPAAGRRSAWTGSSEAARTTAEALCEMGLEGGRIGLEKNSPFLPFRIAEEIVGLLRRATWVDASGLIDDCRIVQSPRELRHTREAARISDSMMLAAIAAAGPGVLKRDVMSAIYSSMFQRGGTYPGFVPLVRSTRALEHEHRTWDDARLGHRDLLFIELSGCSHRYHAPLGRLIFIGGAPRKAEKMQRICGEALQRVTETIAPGATAADVYRAWQDRVARAGLGHYHRHHCGYAVGIGYPPSWSGNGVPIGLRGGSDFELESGMVFHVMSWLLRTGQGDYFLSDTAVVTDTGCEVLTRVPRDLIIR